MIDQSPINPDALEAAARATYEMRNPESWARTWDELEPEEREEEWVKPTRTSTLAYLAAALPEVTSVEELHQLPSGSIVRASGGSAWKKFGSGWGAWFKAGDSLDYEASIVALPARVLYRPEVKP